jgi:hypothetical protein
LPPKIRALAASLFLFLLNLWVVRDLLRIEWLDQMGSIEGTHIALARWVARNWGDLTWFPLWYGGIPFQNAYLPLVPLLAGGLSALSGGEPARVYHVLAGLFYAAGPVTLFWLALALYRSLWPALAAGLMYSLFSPSCWLAAAVRQDAGSAWHARRLQALVQYGEGPHLAAMALIPVALLLLISALRRPGAARGFAAAVGLAAVALTNWLGAAALAAGVFAWLLAQQDGSWRRWAFAGGLAAWAYALACSWIPPSTIRTIRSGERWLSGELSANRRLFGACLLAALLVLRWWCRRRRCSEATAFALLFALPVCSAPLAAYWTGLRAVPQPQRYHLEMEMALALLVPLVLATLWPRLSRSARMGLACAMLVACCYAFVRYERYARRMIRPAAIEQTIEYRVAHWLERNAAGRRVMAPGSIGFFLNAFTDTPQVAGGFDQGAVNPLAAHVRYQILSGAGAGPQEGEVAVLWLKAYGVDLVAVSGPESREIYKPFRNPGKFEGLLQEAARLDGVTVYDLGRPRKSLAHVVRRGDLAPRAPLHGLDVDPARAYVSALEDPLRPEAEFAWTSRHAAVIAAELAPDQILSVQISHHPGWRATAQGRPVRLYGDLLGQIVIEPGCSGACRVELIYDGGPEMRSARAVAWAAWLIGAAACSMSVLRRRRRRGEGLDAGAR